MKALRYILARVRLFFHCLFRFHREWAYSVGGKTVSRGCMDCKKSYWGKCPQWISEMKGWVE